MSTIPSSTSTRTTPGLMGTVKRTNYRWVVLMAVCLFQMVNFADRAIIGVVIPSLRTEFKISNFEAGAIASIFFFGYVLVLIPAGWLMSRIGVTRLVAATVAVFSLITGVMGTASSAALLKVYRVGLGVFEAPAAIGGNATMKNWFPAKERGTAAGIVTAATSSAVMVVPPIAVWILVNHGWRSVFFYFAIPGFLVALILFVFVRDLPESTPYSSAAEAAYIHDVTDAEEGKATVASWGWLDKVLRSKHVDQIDTRVKVFQSKNIYGDALTYGCMQMVYYGLLTWIPSYLVTAKHFSFGKMGWVAAAPWLGGLVGNIGGGMISDKLFGGRRKPMIFISALTTVIMMWFLIHVRADVTSLTITLFLAGVFLNCSWPSFFTYPMGLTTGQIYPLAVSVIITGGNLGAFVSPMTVGFILDRYKSYDPVFAFFAGAAILALILVSFLDEPILARHR